MRYRHLALFAGPDLRAAEAYYAALFGLEAIVREAPTGSGAWAQLPRDKGWDDATAAGVEIGMVALARDDFTLALFPIEPTGERIYTVGLQMTVEEIAAVAARLGDEVVEEQAEEWLSFVDQFGVRWQLASSARFAGSGDTQDRWLEV